jgi:hypothetical protein
MCSAQALQVLASACMAAAEVIVVTVGGNGPTIFVPQRVVAALGDVVMFNCKVFSCPYHDLISTAVTNGNHTATESTFSDPCIPAHETDVTINGFNSGFRNTETGTSDSILTVPIIPQNEYHTFWFFDYNTCGEGGVGVINNNESSSETLAGFSVRVFVLCTVCHLSSVTCGVYFLVFISSTFKGKRLRIIPFFPAKCHPSEWHELFRHDQHQLSDASHYPAFAFDQSTQIGRQPRVHGRRYWRDPTVHCNPVCLEHGVMEGSRELCKDLQLPKCMFLWYPKS